MICTDPDTYKVVIIGLMSALFILGLYVCCEEGEKDEL